MSTVRLLLFVSVGEFSDDIAKINIDYLDDFNRLLWPCFDFPAYSVRRDPDCGFTQVALEVVFDLLLTVFEFIWRFHLADDGAVNATIEVLDRKIWALLLPFWVSIWLCPELVVEEF